MDYSWNDVDEQMDEGEGDSKEQEYQLSPPRLIGGENRYTTPSYPKLPHEDLSDSVLDWQYVMRRTMQEILPGVYLGPYASATRLKLEDMKSAGLTHVICVRQIMERNIIRPNHPEHFKYMVVEIADRATENIIPHFKPVQQFIDECLVGGGKVLVHGNLGVSRSAALVIGYIMAIFGVTYHKAYHFVQMKRFCVEPNEGFKAQLKEYEPIYKAQHTVQNSLLGGESQRESLKRTLDSDEENTQTSFPRQSDAKNENE